MGKAYRIPSATDRLRKQQRQIKDLQALNRNRNTPRPVASTAFSGVSAAGDTGGGTGNFLDPAGDTMIGPFALAPPVDFSVDIDSNGIIDIGESSSNSQYSSNVQFEDIQPNTFVLDTIAGAAYNGQVLILRTFAPSTPITIAQATLANGGNIQTLTDADFDMGDLQMIWLVFDADLIVFDNAPGGTWRVMSFGNEGVVGANIQLSNLGVTAINADLLFDADHDMGTSLIPLDNLNVKTVRLRAGGGVANVPSIHTSTGNILDLNFPLGSQMVLSENSAAKYTWTASSFTAPNIILTGGSYATNLLDVSLDFSASGWIFRVDTGDDIKLKEGLTDLLTVNATDIDAHGKIIKGGITPTLDDDYTIKSYVDSKTAGFARTPLNSALPPVTLTPINWTREITAVVTQV